MSRLSIRAYARYRGVSDTAVRKAIKAGRIVKESDGTIDPVKADAAWERNTNPAQQRQSGANSSANQGTQPKPIQTAVSIEQPENQDVPDYQISRARREAAAAEMAELELAKKRGELVLSAEVENGLTRFSRELRNRLLLLPGSLMDSLFIAESPDIIERRLEFEIKRELEIFSKEIEGMFSEDATSLDNAE